MYLSTAEMLSLSFPLHLPIFLHSSPARYLIHWMVSGHILLYVERTKFYIGTFFVCFIFKSLLFPGFIRNVDENKNAEIDWLLKQKLTSKNAYRKMYYRW